MNPEQLHYNSTVQTIEDGSSIFAGKTEDKLELQPHQRAETYSKTSFENSIPESILRTTRMLLINKPGLLQNDIAKQLGISLYSLEECKSKPEDVLLQEKDYQILASSGLGNIVLERRQERVERIRKHFEEKRRTKEAEELSRKETVKVQAQKKRRKTFNKNKGALRGAASRRNKELLASHEEKEERLSTLHTKKIESLRKKRERNLPLLQQSLTSEEIKFISTLHRPDKETAETLGRSPGYVSENAQRLWKKLGLGSRIELLTWTLNRGMVFDLPNQPDLKDLTLRERQVAMRLAHRDGVIGKKLGLTDTQVGKSVAALIKKTKAVNRTELALMAQTYYFEPFPEEMEEQVHQALEPFTKGQREMVSRLHLPSTLIAAELGMRAGSVSFQLRKARVRVGAESNIDLAVSLHGQGFEFDVKKPKKKLGSLLSELQLSIMRLSHLSNQEIAEELGLKINQVESNLNYVKRKTGARSRVELVLMTQMFDDGETNDEPKPRREELFFKALGLNPLPLDQARKLLAYATKTQAQYLEAYFFNGEGVTWSSVAKQFHVSHSTMTRVTADKGLDRIRSKIQEGVEKRTNPDYMSTRESELLNQLGVEKIAKSKLNDLLEELSPKQRRYIKDYYLSSEEPSWASIEKQYSLSNGAARPTASKGLRVLREKIKELQAV